MPRVPTVALTDQQAAIVRRLGFGSRILTTGTELVLRLDLKPRAMLRVLRLASNVVSPIRETYGAQISIARLVKEIRQALLFSDAHGSASAA